MTSITNGMDKQLQASQKLYKKKLETAYRTRNQRFYADSSTEIGKSCFNRSSPFNINDWDFWCFAFTSMAQDGNRKDLERIISLKLGNDYSKDAIREFVTETFDKTRNS